MKISYTGPSADLLPKQKTKLEAKLQKCVKMIEGRGEREVHVIFSRQRHLHKVEITTHAFDHALAGAGSDADLALAMSEAIEKLETQVIRMREKFRDGHRIKDKSAVPSEPTKAKGQVKSTKAAKAAAPKIPRVFPVEKRDGRKPMTLEEAMLEIGPTDTYLIFRDATTNKHNMLLRRADGHFDLIEA
jgi:putative sigma-54 modulation protein